MNRVAVALPMLLLLITLPGCREDNVSPPGPAPIPLSMHFAPGDHFSYSTWQIDQNGYLVPASHSEMVLRVISTNGTAFGMGNVVFMADSSVSDSTARWTVDTLMFSFSPNGDIYRYGFVAGIVRRLESREMEPAWDRIAAFSLGFDTPWALGSGDSLDGVQFSGVINDQQDYFAVDVNGRQTLVPAYRVSLAAGLYERSIWITDAPPSFTRDLELSGASSSGTLRDLEMIGSASP